MFERVLSIDVTTRLTRIQTHIHTHPNEEEEVEPEDEVKIKNNVKLTKIRYLSS